MHSARAVLNSFFDQLCRRLNFPQISTSKRSRINVLVEKVGESEKGARAMFWVWMPKSIETLYIVYMVEVD